jgi:hypothetical protein
MSAVGRTVSNGTIADLVRWTHHRDSGISERYMAKPAVKSPSAKKGTTTAYFIVAAIVLFIVAMLPFAITSIFTDATELSAPVYEITEASDSAPVRADLHLQVIALNEWESTASIRVAAHQSCDRTCPWGDRYLFASVFGDTSGQTDTRPASEAVTLPATARDVTQVIKLPIFGDPIRYPFDEYRLAVGVVVDRLFPDGTVSTLTAEEAREYVTLSLQGRIPRATMGVPVTIDPATIRHAHDPEPYLTVELLTFERPLYTRVLTILLVLLVTAAAAYAVFMRPLDQLIVNSGALVLGVWGIRSILLGSSLPGLTAVDLALSVVILFLLATLTVRTLYLLEESSAVRFLRRRSKEPAAEESKPPSPGTQDYVPGMGPPPTADPSAVAQGPGVLSNHG